MNNMYGLSSDGFYYHRLVAVGPKAVLIAACEGHVFPSTHVAIALLCLLTGEVVDIIIKTHINNIFKQKK